MQKRARILFKLILTAVLSLLFIWLIYTDEKVLQKHLTQPQGELVRAEDVMILAGELGKALEQVEIYPLKIPYVANVTAEYVTDEALVKPLLMRQVYSSVRWQQSVETMLKDGVDTFVEIGPGKTLSGFMKKINRNVAVLNIEKLDDLEKVGK